MSHEDIIRAWKDAEYRMTLSEEERAQLPENPAGVIELTDGEMTLVGGGYDLVSLGGFCTITTPSCIVCPSEPKSPPEPVGTAATVTVNGQICCSSGCACM
jgi:mersacidin/lichenicidin family type 2 lantibiotic